MEPDSLSFLTLINEAQSHSNGVLGRLGVLGVSVFKTPPFRLIIGSWSCIIIICSALRQTSLAQVGITVVGVCLSNSLATR